MNSFIGYIDHVAVLLGELKRQEGIVLQLVDEIVSRATQSKQVIVFGNGGSAATASHFVCDIAKGTITPGCPRVRALCLTDNTSLVTAWANDESYDSIFAEQLKGCLDHDDLVVAISGSGNSPNVLRAVEAAKEGGATCFGLCGFDGGQLARLAHYAVVIPAENIQQVEDIHLLILHSVSLLVKERLEEWQKAKVLVMASVNSRGRR
ncbi:Phosphoheptose isomerase [subsurface metagenome]